MAAIGHPSQLHVLMGIESVTLIDGNSEIKKRSKKHKTCMGEKDKTHSALTPLGFNLYGTSTKSGCVA